jgi:SAM-dependent methyltransferase
VRFQINPNAKLLISDKKRLKKLAKLSYGRVLDIGCNDNPNIFLRNPIGLDLSDFNRQNAGNYDDIIVGDCNKVSKYFPKRFFDTIIAGELIEHLENPAGFLKQCKKILKDDGQLLVTTPNPYNLSTIVANVLFIEKRIAPGHISMQTYRNMIALFKHCGLRCEKVLNAIGGTRLHPSNRYIIFPMFKSFCGQLLYIIRKQA